MDDAEGEDCFWAGDKGAVPTTSPGTISPEVKGRGGHPEGRQPPACFVLSKGARSIRKGCKELTGRAVDREETGRTWKEPKAP